jgi:hypothetical protein
MFIAVLLVLLVGIYIMNRRGFFRALLPKTPDVGFFGIQILYATGTDDTVPKQLRDIIAEYDDQTMPHDKKRMYKRIVALLLDCFPYYEYGFWDFVDDGPAARTEFASWANDVESSMATETEEMGAEHDEMHRMSSEKSYIAVSMLFLVNHAGGNEDFFALMRSLPEKELWTRETFKKLIDACDALNFEAVESDAVFVVPGNDDDGLSWEDIHGGGWEYLRSIV